jgi:hypothetical protein
VSARGATRVDSKPPRRQQRWSAGLGAERRRRDARIRGLRPWSSQRAGQLQTQRGPLLTVTVRPSS